MFKVAGDGVENSSVVLSGFARNALKAFRLPKYSALAGLFSSIGAFSMVLDIMSGFRERFGAPEIRPGVAYSLVDLGDWVLCKIAECLFPLDDDYISEMLYATEEPEDCVFGGPVPIETFGAPWEMMGVYSKAGYKGWDCLMPLLALGYRSLPADERVGDALLLLEENLMDMAMNMGGELPEMRPYDVLERLQELPAPIGPGLAAGWKMLWRGSGNVFLDMLPAEYLGDYGEFFFDAMGYSFSVHDLKELERAWQEAKPEVDAYYEYGQWWQDTLSAKAQVENALIGLFGDMLGVGDDDE